MERRPRRTQLRNKFKTNGQIYRVFPNGEVQYLHPKDGVYPEKVNAGRQAVNTNSRRIGANPNPIAVRAMQARVQRSLACSVGAAPRECWAYRGQDFDLAAVLHTSFHLAPAFRRVTV